MAGAAAGIAGLNGTAPRIRQSRALATAAGAAAKFCALGERGAPMHGSAQRRRPGEAGPSTATPPAAPVQASVPFSPIRPRADSNSLSGLPLNLPGRRPAWPDRSLRRRAWARTAAGTPLKQVCDPAGPMRRRAPPIDAQSRSQSANRAGPACSSSWKSASREPLQLPSSRPLPWASRT